MKKDKGCALCRYNRANGAETPYKGMYCVFEESVFFGSADKDGKRERCEHYEESHYKELSLKEALLGIGLPKGTRNTIYSYNYGKNGDPPYMAIFFEDNKSLEDYKDSLIRCFSEYMDKAKTDSEERE